MGGGGGGRGREGGVGKKWLFLRVLTTCRYFVCFLWGFFVGGGGGHY